MDINIVKIIISLFLILTVTTLAKKVPALAGLIAVMPLTGALILFWVAFENKENYQLMTEFSKSALLGLVPTIIFFLVAFVCFKYRISIFLSLFLSFSSWVFSAIIHQWILKR